MASLRLILLAAALLAIASIAPGLAVALAPTLALDPSTGQAPSESGRLSGAGWICASGSAPTGDAAVRGVGVSGTASINRDGTLNGAFTVQGTVGQQVQVLVSASVACPSVGPPIHLSANAVFIFNPAATRTPTAMPSPTPSPSSTPSPTPVPATLTPTPTPAVLPSATNTPAPASPTDTPTPASAGPTNTPVPGITAVPALPQAATPTATQGPAPALAPPPDTSTITFVGCEPEAAQVQVKFILLAAGATDPDVPPRPSQEPPLTVDVRPSSTPRVFDFEPPPVPPGGVYRVQPEVSNPDCGPVTDSPSFWLAGHDLSLSHTLPGNTQLRLSSNAPLDPCDDYVSGGELSPCWVVQSQRYGDLNGATQAFKWTTTLTGAEKVLLQASVLPFTSGGDVFAPGGLVASWEADKDGIAWKQNCGLCEVDLTLIAPPASAEPNNDSGLGAVEIVAISAIIAAIAGGGFALSGVLPLVASAGVGLAAGTTMLATGLIFFAGGDDKTQGTQASAGTTPGGTIVDQLDGVEYLIDAFYFRVVPLTGEGDLAGGPSNPVTLKWAEKSPENELIGEALKCLATPTPSDCPTPTPPPPMPYIVDILSYHGIVPPTNPKSCFIATKDAWPADAHGLNFTTNQADAAISQKAYAVGDLICEPEPDEPECSISDPLECVAVVLSFIGEGLEWVGGVWSDLKAFVVTTFMEITQLGSLCEELDIESTCTQVVKTALDAALMALGIPPDIPSFEDLMDQGIEYLAAQAASQISIPPEVIEQAKQLDQYAGWVDVDIEATLKEEAEAAIKDNLEKQIETLQYSYAKNVDWLPNGVPVTPDPTSSTQPPTVTLKVTRNPAVPGTFASCQLAVLNSVTNDFNTQGVNVPASAQEWLKPGLDYPLYSTEYLPLPILDAGESVEIPIVLKPELTTWLYSHPEVQMYWSLYELWFSLYAGGTVKLHAGSGAAPCIDGDSLVAPAAEGAPGWQ